MKTWIKINLGRITLILATLALIIATTGLILGAKSNSKTNELNYYLDYDYEAHWGAPIWAEKVSNYHKIKLYFGIKPSKQDDIKWNGIYPDGYFDK
ncbi:hypothetical protein [Spiroplasma endosymbiont of Amphimallon solstitiale]|uniref:hypothetical protein n=1 Tax=Spiroplasma endosymbiont of Amphimallon solstitiale TaxID=3066288 RepID=UPI00313C1CC6